MNLNKVFIVGNLTRDPETRTIPSGQNVTTFSIATNRVWTDSSREKKQVVEYHNIVAWGKLAEICGQYLNKGRLVLIEGRLQTRSWQDQDGTKRNRTEIIAENMQMGPRPQEAGFQGDFSQPAGEQEPVIDQSPEQPENKSDQGKAPAQKSNQQKEKPAEDEEEIKVEDIPF